MNLLERFPFFKSEKEEQEIPTSLQEAKWVAMKTRMQSIERLQVIAKNEQELRDSFRLGTEKEALLCEKIQLLLLKAMENETKAILKCLEVELVQTEDLQD